MVCGPARTNLSWLTWEHRATTQLLWSGRPWSPQDRGPADSLALTFNAANYSPNKNYSERNKRPQTSPLRPPPNQIQHIQKDGKNTKKKP
eukprot:3140757-Amphidinium_carterae.1